MKIRQNIFFLSGAGMEHKFFHTRVKYDALSYDLSDCVQVYKLTCGLGNTS